MDGTSPWSDWYNAEVYNLYVHEYPIYEALNRQLVALAELAGARRVLDLACGAGATAQACLRLLPAHAELVGVDASEPMVELARMQIRDPRARFVISGAAALEEVIEGTFDRAVCNTAFWQFPSLRPVLDALGRLLEPGALFVFNVPAERVTGQPADVHPFQAALARAIEDRTECTFPPSAVEVDPAKLEGWLGAAGFDLVDEARFIYKARQSELLELMTVPAMIAPLTPGMTPEARLGAVRSAAERVDPAESVEVPWIYFVVRRQDSPT